MGIIIMEQKESLAMKQMFYTDQLKVQSHAASAVYRSWARHCQNKMRPKYPQLYKQCKISPKQSLDFRFHFYIFMLESGPLNGNWNFRLVLRHFGAKLILAHVPKEAVSFRTVSNG